MISRLKPISKTISKSTTTLTNDNITIDAKHLDMINYFKGLQDSIPSLKEELKKMILEYNIKDNNRKNDIDYILYKDYLKEKINETKDKINSILNNEEMNKYYLDVGLLLHSYYENIETSKNTENNYSESFEENLINYDNFDDDEYSEEESLNEEVKKDNYKSVINFFQNRENNELEDSLRENNKENNKENNNENNKENNKENGKNDGVYTSMKISDFVKEETRFKKKDFLDEYLQKIDPKYEVKIKIDINICKCPGCSNEMTLYPSDGIQICEYCGIQENILIESDKPSFKDPPMEVCYFSYRRINHYNEFQVYTTKNVLTNTFLTYILILIN
jgi:hypothetical protein